MDGDGPIVGAVNSTATDVRGAHISHQVEMEGVPAKLECLEDEDEKKRCKS